jgi:hypothetical protein
MTPFTTEGMMLPVMGFLTDTNCCCGIESTKIPEPHTKGKLNAFGWMCISAVAADTVVAITFLTLGILCVLHGAPSMASFSLIALSGTIITLWIASAIKTEGSILTFTKSLFCGPEENINLGVSGSKA